MATAVSLAMVLVGLLNLPLAGTASDVPLEGLDHADGVSPNGGEYEGLVRIIQFGESYLVSWTFTPDAALSEEGARFHRRRDCRRPDVFGQLLR